MGKEPSDLAGIAGCEQKVGAKGLDELLAALSDAPAGRGISGTRDDAAVAPMRDGVHSLASLDFGAPVFADASLSGRIAAANALSDIFAMGGKPIHSLAIIGVSPAPGGLTYGARLLASMSQTCDDAGASIVGGHSLQISEPLAGLAVTGSVTPNQLRYIDGGRPGDLLYLSKRLGTGLALARARHGDGDVPDEVIETMCQVNFLGASLGSVAGVHAMTDVTGFGLAGHLSGMCRASNVNAHIDLARLPVFSESVEYATHGFWSPAARRNWEAFGQDLGGIDVRWRSLLSDPQTNGGLLIAVAPDAAAEVEHILSAVIPNSDLGPIGMLRSENSGTRLSVSPLRPNEL